MAQTALRKTASEVKETFPKASQVIKDNSYMNDICDSVHTEEEAQKLTTEIDSVLETGGFKVKGWLTNELSKSDTDPEEANEATILQCKSEENVLGVVWNSATDTFTLKVRADFLNWPWPEPIHLSKRKILSQVQRINILIALHQHS